MRRSERERELMLAAALEEEDSAFLGREPIRALRSTSAGIVTATTGAVS